MNDGILGMTYDGGIDMYNNRLRTFYLAEDTSTDVLPTATDGKGYGVALVGDMAMRSDKKVYFYFGADEGWKEMSK